MPLLNGLVLRPASAPGHWDDGRGGGTCLQRSLLRRPWPSRRARSRVASSPTRVLVSGSILELGGRCPHGVADEALSLVPLSQV